MKMMVTVVPLLVAILVGAQPGEASTHATVASVSHFLKHKASDFLDHVQNHFDNSLTYLFTGNAFGDQSIQRPGLAKVLKEESDRHWNLGIDALKKYLQRGGNSSALLGPKAKRSTVDAKKSNKTLSQAEIFEEKFNFTGNNWLASPNKGKSNFTNTYLLQFEKLVTDCKTTVVQVNKLHRASMKESKGNNTNFDADMGHYLEEKLEKEVALMRKFSNLHTSLEKVAEQGLAQHIFDKSLSD